MNSWQKLISTGFFVLALAPSLSYAVDFLNEHEVVQLEKIIVTPSRINQVLSTATHNVSVLDKKMIETIGAQDVPELLGVATSVDVLDYGAAGAFKSVMIRGAAASQVLTLVDGRPVQTPRDGLADLTMVPLSNIERIEIVRGPASSIYGANAVGGVVNIITKNGSEKMFTEVTTRTGSFKTNQVSFSHGYKIKDTDYFLTYDYNNSRGHRDNSGYLSHAATTKIGYRLNDDHRVEIAGGFSTAELGSPGLQSFMDLDDRQDTDKKYVQCTYRGSMFEKQDLLVSFYHNRERLEFIESFDPITKNAHQTSVYGVDTQWSQTFFSLFRTAIGISFQDNGIDSTTSAKHDYNLKGVYVETELDVTKRGTIKAGIRWDDYSNFGDQLSPSVSFNYRVIPEIRLHALAARSFRAPTFNDLYWPREDWGMWGGVEGNASLGPEEATSYEAGIGSAFFGNRLKTDITLFKTKYQDLIEWTVDNTWWWRPNNISSAVTKGMEWEVEYALSEKCSALFNYTYLKAINTGTKKWLIYRPRHMYKLAVQYRPHPRWEFGVAAQYKTKRFSNADNTEFLKHFAVMNCSATYTINKVVDAFFEIKNLFNRRYQEQRDYPLSGRAFYGGMRARF